MAQNQGNPGQRQDQGNPGQQQLNRFTVIQGGRRDDAAFQSELEPGGVGTRVGLAADVLVFERGCAEEFVPVDRRNERLQFTCVHSGGKRSAEWLDYATEKAKA